MLRVLYKLAMLPLLVGICYEILKWAGRSNSLLARAVSVPGLWLQHLTTFEPEDDMIEVAIASVEAVFDWRAYLMENFPSGPADQEEKEKV